MRRSAADFAKTLSAAVQPTLDGLARASHFPVRLAESRVTPMQMYSFELMKDGKLVERTSELYRDLEEAERAAQALLNVRGRAIGAQLVRVIENGSLVVFSSSVMTARV
jgi:hypothetical protein